MKRSTIYRAKLRQSTTRLGQGYGVVLVAFIPGLSFWGLGDGEEYGN